MVDFKTKRVAGTVRRILEPKEIYERLDRASDKGPMRGAQERVLAAWHANRRADQDVILKLHTGQGKTLIGLLILQSKMNERDGRAIYLCPNLYLVQQSLLQARQFGIACVKVGDDGSIPSEFLDGKAILVSSVQKLFNGLTKFGLGPRSVGVDYIVLDDAHACIEAIHAACQITLANGTNAYHEIISLFEDDLKRQGIGSFAEILQGSGGDYGPLLPVPYWAWTDREVDVARILSRHADSKEIKFAWPLLRDRLKFCQCVVSGSQLVIAPSLPSLDLFGSYTNASHRVFMSATVTDDSFLVKGLGLSRATVSSPLVDPEETWSGERMILIPSLTSSELDEGFVVAEFGKKQFHRRHNVVAFTPSFAASKGWEAAGAVVADKTSIEALLARLRDRISPECVVVVNRYDGIDLPDDACRILILDGLPFGETLWERYNDECRPGSEISIARTARTIEQGLGRGVRGEKDYCVVIVTGADLVRTLRSREIKKYLSDQTKEQVEIGLEISDEAKGDIETHDPPFAALRSLMEQCLERNEDWKEFYKERMDAIHKAIQTSSLLEVFSREREAELNFQSGQEREAAARIQALLDSHGALLIADKGWYLQEIARYQYAYDKALSQRTQTSAHRSNRYLLKPEAALVSKLGAMDLKRPLAIIRYLQEFASDEQALLTTREILSNLRHGVRAETFEKAWCDLGRALGFTSERPDKEWKEGPDNLWALRAGLYLMTECKSEVEPTRRQINKDEVGQMNNSCAWFEREYSGAIAINVMIISTAKVTSAAGFNRPVRIMRKRDLAKFVHHVGKFFGDLAAFRRDDLDETKVGELLAQNGLEVDQFSDGYTSAPEQQS
jgi:replicative superfamily II helicase